MPRQFGKVDISATWACANCPHRHAPAAPCPPAGVWLVLAMCHRCDPKTGAYCRWHGGHRPEPGGAHHTLPEAGDDVQRRAAGERSEG